MKGPEKIAELLTAVIAREGMDNVTSFGYSMLKNRVEIHVDEAYFFDTFTGWDIEYHSPSFRHICYHTTPSGAAIFCLTNRFAECAA